MNDRFRFRAYWYNDVFNEWMIYENPELITGDGTCKVFENGESGADEWRENVILCQCTGLKDKNGKLIYEGDIVRLKAKNGMTFDYAVKYKNYCFILEYINGKLKSTKARDFAKQYAQPQRMYEHGYMVIGNIYENKELLQESEV